MPTPGQVSVIPSEKNKIFMDECCAYYRWRKTDFVNACIDYVRAMMVLTAAVKDAKEPEERAAWMDLVLKHGEHLVNIPNVDIHIQGAYIPGMETGVVKQADVLDVLDKPKPAPKKKGGRK